MEAVAVAARLVQFLAACAVCGTSLFLAYGHRPASDRPWRRALAASSAAGALATALWLMTQAAQLGAGPADMGNPALVWSVATGTSFGLAALVRLALFALGGWLLLAGVRGAANWPAAAALGALVAASFVWTGHGVFNDGATGVIHGLADAAHLIAAAIWIGALPPLLWLLSRRAPSPSGIASARAGLDAFSRIGPAVVAVLAATGLVNGWLLVGPHRVLDLPASPYGRILIAKLLLFAGMLALAAGNRFLWSPRLSPTGMGDNAAKAMTALKRSVLCETILAVAILALVGWLGTLTPPIDAG